MNGSPALPDADDPRTQLERMTPALLAWAHMRLPGRPTADAEDLTQEILCRAVTRLETFTGGNLAAWVFTIGKHVLLEHLRRQRKIGRTRHADGHSSAYDAMAEVAAQMTTLTRRVAKNDDLRGLLHLLDELDQVDRDLAILCGMEGQTCGAAAIQLGMTEDAVSKRWQRLRQKLAARAAWLRE
ncbi:MAG: sigma-70 family RNA polymerase sigma factor [Planctomycetes bacterium]|nr:sigma-70 family RNA polymerase sigma factor [Planctomycetota bacterium]